MNHKSGENPIFSDNLCQAYQTYKPPTNSGDNTVKEALYLKNRLVEFMNRVNNLRQDHYAQYNVEVDKRELLVDIKQAFKAYFEVQNEIVRQELDGGWPMSSDRDTHMIEVWDNARFKAVADDLPKTLRYINHLVYKQVPFFGDLSTAWTITFSSKILEQVQVLNDKTFLVLLFYMAIVRRGLFFLHPCIGGNQKHRNWMLDPVLAYSVLFCEALDSNQVIVGAILPMRTPRARDEHTLKDFTYSQYVYFTELCPPQKVISSKTGTTYDLHKKHLLGDQDLANCFFFTNTNLKVDRPDSLTVATQYKNLFSGDFLTYQIHPLKIFKWMLKEPPVSHFSYDPATRRWIQTQFGGEKNSADYVDQELISKTQQRKIKENIITKLDDSKHSAKLAEILDMMPTLKITLSDLQRTVVASHQNLLCLGRSGTGKTTTSVLRLFSQEIMYRVMYKTEAQNEKKAILQASDLTSDTGMKMVFITASPVLTNEVKRYYSNIKASLQKHLQTREERKRKQQESKAAEEEPEQAEIELQVESVEDQERRELLEFIRREEKILEEDLTIDNNMNLPNAFHELQPKHFPLFTTFKKLILLMDACLNYSFFSRDYKNNIIGLDSNLGWHNESKGVMMINHYYKENIQYDDLIAKFGKELLELDKDAEIVDDDLGDNFLVANQPSGGNNNNNQNQVSGINNYNHNRIQYVIERQQLSFEVDYDIFEQKFWPKIASNRSMRRLSPTLVWTEIYSVIKGGMQSNDYYQGYLPMAVYLETDSFLKKDEKRTVYYIFLEYEKWKYQNNAYDFMDVVTHVQKRIWYGDTLQRMSIDYLMVDEVQDLTPKMLKLLLSVTKHKVFFAGDTAQTIAKGVGARFHDLRYIFSTMQMSVPKIVQLTKNYRSHGRILDLANSVVSLVELFFPKTIDRLAKEESDSDGMKPLVIMPLDAKHLKNLFTGANISAAQNATEPQFGCNQVLIVRDQAAKDHVPELFKNMLCLSVYEAKGLEFDDVILYNFFHLGDVQKSQWKLLNDIIYETVNRVKYKEELLDFDKLDVEEFQKYMQQIKQQERSEAVEYETETQLNIKQRREHIYRKFSMLCIELKFLYVAITRPKKRLIIYDDMAADRQPIQAFWEKLGVIQVITKDMVQQPEEMAEDVRNLFEIGAIQQHKSSEEEWRIQGIKLFKKKYYDSAIKCFQFSNDQDLVQRCLAYQEADQGSQKTGEADSRSWRAKVMLHLPKIEKKKLLREAKRIRLQANEHFRQAGAHFESIKMLKHAASCFFTGKDYSRAATIFEQLESFGQAAECLATEGQLKQAARLYEKANLISKAIECYEQIQEWDQLLHCLHRNKDYFKAEERESLVNKYVPVALNSLYRLYSEEDGGADEENRGKLQEMKMKMKYQKNVNKIEEEDEEELSSEEEEVEETVENAQEGEDEEEVKEEEDKGEGEEGEKQDNNGDDDMVDVVSEDDEAPNILEEIFQLKKHHSKTETPQEDSNTHSFEIIDSPTKLKNTQVRDQEQIQEHHDPKTFDIDNFEHLSQYDPDDEFLRSSKSVSIIESILSKKSISQTSEFSIISMPGANKSQLSASIISLANKSNSRIAQVESNRDMYAEDVITQKIIYYISLFSDEVCQHLKKLRSTKALFTNLEENKQVKEEDLFMIDLDQIDAEFVNLILDVLEYYELFRLCLMICNRYHMSERLGRYIISVCSKYSNLNLHRFNLTLYKENNINQLWQEKQRQASILSHEAIHNVFSLIEPKFLGLKDLNTSLTSDNSLGIEAYRMMLDLGFWKKLVYILSSRTSLQLCNKVIDRENFEVIRDHIKVENEQDEKWVQRQYAEVVVKDLQKRKFQLIWNQNRELNKTSLSQLKKELEEDESIKKDENLLKYLQALLDTSSWLYSLVEVDSKSIDLDFEEAKAQDIISKKQEEETKSINSLFKTLVFSNPTEDCKFSAYNLAMEFLLNPFTPFYNKFLQCTRQHFDSATVSNLVNLYSRTLKQLNLQFSYQQSEEPELLAALYSSFLVSDLREEGSDKLFKQYSADYMLMDVQSPLFKDVMNLQQNFANAQTNLFMLEKVKDLCPRYFNHKNLNQALAQQLRTFSQKQGQKHTFMLDKYEQAFILDMDANLLMVPKNWITKLLAIRILTLNVSLVSALRSHVRKETIVHSIEDEISISGHEIEMLQKIRRELLTTADLHQPYITHLLKEQERIADELKQYPQVQNTVRAYWQKVNPYQINFDTLKQNSSVSSGNCFSLIKRQMRLCFDMGIIHKKQKIQGLNDILNEAFQTFESAFDKAKLEQYTLRKNEYVATQVDDVARDQYMLATLLKSFSYFVLADKYEYMLEIIKKKKKSLKGNSLKLMNKFMSVLDIHVYLKCRQWSAACESMLGFLKDFSGVLSLRARAKLLQQAFYLVSISKFGKGYFPDYVMKLLDVSYDLSPYYPDGKQPEERERLVIEESLQGVNVEKITTDALYNKILEQIIKLGEELNQDEQASAHKDAYKIIYNILMTVCVNDAKKSSKTLNQVCEGFTLLTTGPFDEYFLSVLQDYDYSQGSGLNDIMKDFQNTENEYKHEFFSSSQKLKGSFLVHLDVTKCQTSEAQNAIKTMVDKSYFKEFKTLASHIELKQRLHKVYKQKRTYFQCKSYASKFEFSDRQLAHCYGLTELLMIDQFPGKLILALLRKLILKDIVLKQLIVAKYATNSLDLHYILSKSVEVETLTNSFLEFIKAVLQEKGNILKEFVEVNKDNESELYGKVQETSQALEKIEKDIQVWMNTKAEPNLVEVEIKTKRYKLKWESLKLFEKKQRLLQLKKKEELVMSK